jgi:hypothetical protein
MEKLQGERLIFQTICMMQLNTAGSIIRRKDEATYLQSLK